MQFRPTLLVRCSLFVAAAMVLATPAKASGDDHTATAISPVVTFPVEEPAADPVEVDFPEHPLAPRVRHLLEDPGVRKSMVTTAEGARVWKMMVQFYERRGFSPGWTDDETDPTIVFDLFAKIRGSQEHGLNPEHYAIEPLEDLLTTLGDHPDEIARLDIFLSHLFLTFAGHLHHGRLDPFAFEEVNWHIPLRKTDLARTLEHALDNGQIGDALESLVPSHPQYRFLKRALAGHRELAGAGGWPVVPPVAKGFRVERGDSVGELGAVREFLHVTGDLAPGPPADPNIMDGILEAGVRRFQGRHGIGVDGVLGPRTMATMAVPVEKRIETILLTMERWRWMPDTLGTRYIVVNIPQFELRVVEDPDTVFAMRVIAGTEDDETPSFTQKMSYLELNPRWNVPSSIATEEIFPKVLEDSTYLVNSSFAVVDRKTGETVHPDSVAWATLNPDSMDYRFRQDSGPANSLGSIKFIFPNKFAIYLHDTPKEYLFKRYRRAFSHGCVRVEKPLEFAEYLLQSDPEWDLERIEETIQSRKRTRVDLSELVPVYLLYLAAYQGEEGGAGFCSDIYGQDRILRQLLDVYTPPVSYSLAAPQGLSASQTD